MSHPKIIRVEQEDSSVLSVTWIVNNICPNSCSYCPPVLHKGSNHGYDWDNARRFIHLLLERYPKIHLSIAGGEPSMSPFLPELVRLFHDRGHTVSLTTNGYKNPEYWRDIAEHVTTIGFSYHPEFVTDQYFENLAVASEIVKTGARVMMLSSHWDQCVAAYERLNASTRHVTNAVRINNWGTNNGTDEYTPEQLEWFNQNPANNIKLTHHNNTVSILNRSTYYYEDGTSEFNPTVVRLINNDQTRFRGWSCEIGLRSLFIGWGGFIKRGNCMAGGYIGNIDTPEEIQWPDAPIICPADLCHCTSDVVINKRMP